MFSSDLKYTAPFSHPLSYCCQCLFIALKDVGCSCCYCGYILYIPQPPPHTHTLYLVYASWLSYNHEISFYPLAARFAFVFTMDCLPDARLTWPWFWLSRVFVPAMGRLHPSGGGSLQSWASRPGTSWKNWTWNLERRSHRVWRRRVSGDV